MIRRELVLVLSLSPVLQENAKFCKTEQLFLFIPIPFPVGNHLGQRWMWEKSTELLHH